MEFVRPRKIHLSLDMAPLIDIVFLLLIFFMLSSSFMTPSIRMNLPKASTQDAGDSESVVLSIDKTGRLYLNTHSVRLEDLKSKLQPMIAENPKRAVNIRGDRDMPYKYFIQVMDQARQSGARQVNVVHEGAS